MERENDLRMPGARFGVEAVQCILERARDFCICEKQRIELTNQPRILLLRAEVKMLQERREAMEEQARHAVPAGDLRSRRRRSRYYWAITATLAVAGFFFTLLAFDPFRLGWKSYLYCIGIAVIAPVVVDKFLDVWASLKLTKLLTITACLAALTALLLLASIRGEVLTQQVSGMEPAVTFAGEAASVTAHQNDFYGNTLPRLKLLMMLLAISMELGAGLALHDARRLGEEAGEDFEKLEHAQVRICEQMGASLYELATLQNAPGVFVTEFWRDFTRVLLGGTVESALKRFSMVLICFLLIGPVRAWANPPLNVVIAVDLTQSVDVKSLNETEFQKNIAGVSAILRIIPEGTRVSIIGITDRSFAQPSLLLSARVSDDPGYFRERLDAARRQIVHAWQERSVRLRSKFPHTDIFGALLVAAELFHRTPEAHNVLIIFSDMRNETREMNLETPAIVPVNSMLARAEKQKLIADLDGVEIYALGVDDAGKSVGYWQSLRSFWSAYFLRAGSKLESFTVLRDPPDFERRK